MFERFTEKAIKVIMLAQEEARRLNQNYVGTEQILLGLIREDTGIAARSLKEHKVTLKDSRLEVEKIIGRGRGKVEVEIAFTPRSKRVLESSWQAARIQGVSFISTEHILLGVLGEDDGVAIQVLKILNVDLDVLKETVHKLVRKVSDPAYSTGETILSKCDTVNSALYAINHELVSIVDEITQLCTSNKIKKSDAILFKKELEEKFAQIADSAKQICLPEVFDFSQELSKIDEWIETLK